MHDHHHHDGECCGTAHAVLHPADGTDPIDCGEVEVTMTTDAVIDDAEARSATEQQRIHDDGIAALRRPCARPGNDVPADIRKLIHKRRLEWKRGVREQDAAYAATVASVVGTTEHKPRDYKAETKARHEAKAARAAERQALDTAIAEGRARHIGGGVYAIRNTSEEA